MSRGRNQQVVTSDLLQSSKLQCSILLLKEWRW